MIRGVARLWRGDEYDLVTAPLVTPTTTVWVNQHDPLQQVSRNCNHFSEHMCHTFLPGVEFPSWVNRLASWGSALGIGGTFTVSPHHTEEAH